MFESKALRDSYLMSTDNNNLTEDFFIMQTKLRNLFMDKNSYINRIPRMLEELETDMNLYCDRQFEMAISYYTELDKNAKMCLLDNAKYIVKKFPNVNFYNIPTYKFDIKKFYLVLNNKHYLYSYEDHAWYKIKFLDRKHTFTAELEEIKTDNDILDFMNAIIDIDFNTELENILTIINTKIEQLHERIFEHTNELANLVLKFDK